MIPKIYLLSPVSQKERQKCSVENMLKLRRYSERYKSTYSRRLANAKQDTFKEIQTQTQHNQTAENERSTEQKR